MADDAFAIADTARIVQIPASLTKNDAILIARQTGLVVIEGRATVAKYNGEGTDRDPEPYEVIHSDPNLALTAGITLLWQLAAGLGGTAWSSANARIAVGTGFSPVASAGQTALVAETARQIVDSAPNVSGASVSFVATFGTGSANVNWREMGITNASSGGTFLNRLVQDFGTKSSASSWVATLTLTAA